MIGQKNNLEKIFQWRMNRSTPRFIIITGDKGEYSYDNSVKE